MDKQTLLDNYFLNTLSVEDLDRFHALLESDKLFKEQFEFEVNLQKVVYQEERLKLKTKLQGYEKNRAQTDKKNQYWTPLLMAASVAVLFMLGWYVYNANFAINTERLYAQNYDPYPNTVYPITRGQSVDNSLERKAFEAYEAEENKIAIDYFEQLKLVEHAPYVDFYLALSYLADNQPHKAIPLFKKEISSKTEYFQESRWYLALAYLKSDKQDNAIQALRDLVNGGSYKISEAKSLLSRLE